MPEPLGRLWGRLASGPGRLGVLAAVLMAGLLGASCANGTYPLDFFYEMHYQQSYGSYEPPRLSPPQSAVPITGREVLPTENPIPGQRAEEGGRLFAANCVFCHGAKGEGDGAVLRTMKRKYNYGTDERPYTITPDFTDDFVVNQADIGLFGWITNGVIVMPSFDKLLTVEERWLLVNYIRTLQRPTNGDGDGDLADCPPDAPGGKGIFCGVPENAAPQALWCSQCHTIEGVASGLIGPDLTRIGTDAATRKPGTSAEDYIRESIEDPKAFVAEGVERATPGLMTNDITEKLTAEQVDALVEFLLEQK